MNLLLALLVLLLLVGDCRAEKTKKKRRERSLDATAPSGTAPSSNAIVRAIGSLDITGTAHVTAVPDVALISMTAESTDASAKAAFSANNVLVKKVVKALESSGIEAKDVQTSDLSLAPVYSYETGSSKRKMDGWRAAQEVVVKVNDLSKTSTVLDSALGSSPPSSSSSLLTVNQVSLSVADPKKYKTEARAAAVKDAQDKATALCALLGVRLGRPMNIHESEMDSGGGGHRSHKMQPMAADSSATIMPGEREISHSVFVTFETL